MTKSKWQKLKNRKTPVVKWAQMTAENRANKRLEDFRRNNIGCDDYKFVKLMDREELKRARNTYSQLLSHWCKLYKAKSAASS